MDLTEKIGTGGVEKVNFKKLGGNTQGKGSFPRVNYTDEKYKKNYDKIFRKNKDKEWRK